MNSITIILIVVVALLTIIIVGLTWLAYNSCIKSYRLEVNQGVHDEEIYEEYNSKKRHKGGLVGIFGSYIILSLLLALLVTGIVYKARGENLSINNQTALVIKTGSMSDFYNDEIAEKYDYDKSLQFGVGDICIFKNIASETELIEGEVYGYKHKNDIITHRLVAKHGNVYEFRGDNNAISDGFNITREDIIYHYTGHKILVVGSFILYAQSIFGIWSLIGILIVAVGSEVIYRKINKINKDRSKQLSGEKLPKNKDLSDIEVTSENFSKTIAFILDIWPKQGGHKDEE